MKESDAIQELQRRFGSISITATELDVITKELQTKLNVRSDNKYLILLHAYKQILQNCDDDEETRKLIGLYLIALSGFHDLIDEQLLDFFETTREAVLQYISEKILKEFGLYKTLLFTPELSTVCELFFNAVKPNLLKCRVRRIGMDEFKIVLSLSDATEMEYPRTLTSEEVLEVTNISLEDIEDMPLLM